MTRKQAISIKKYLPSGYIGMVQQELTKKSLPTASQPTISNIAGGRKQNPDIERAILVIVRREKSRRKRQDQLIKSLAR